MVRVGWGIVYRLTPNLGRPGWTETILYEFKGSGDHNDGANPIGGVVLDSKGNLYGTSELGGRSNWGTVFESTPQPDGTWQDKVIYTSSLLRTGETPAERSPLIGLEIFMA